MVESLGDGSSPTDHAKQIHKYLRKVLEIKDPVLADALHTAILERFDQMNQLIDPSCDQSNEIK